MTTTRKITAGTREWADSNVNCVDGCAHDCRYCYAKKMAIRFGRATGDTWKSMRVRDADVSCTYRKRRGRIMFPTAHDLVPADPSFEPCMSVLERLLRAGNNVLVTTKPHMPAITRICNELEQYREQVQFRLTITSMDDTLLRFWEPGAPAFHERYDALQFATLSGFETSISIEPILDATIAGVQRLYCMLEPFVTGSIWLGIMNYTKDGVKVNIPGIYRAFSGKTRIRFKDSIMNVVSRHP